MTKKIMICVDLKLESINLLKKELKRMGLAGGW